MGLLMSSPFDLKTILAITLAILITIASFFVAPPLTVTLVLVPLFFCLPGISIMKRVALLDTPNQALELAVICISGYFVSTFLL